MENEPVSSERPIDSNQAITEVIVEALLCVYDSEADLEVDDIVDSVWIKTGYLAEDCAKLVNFMFEDGPNKYLQHTQVEGQGSAFAVEGLWLIENCFMHGEDSIDSMALAERILSKTRYIPKG